ncbi:MAG: sugar phosphate isomerase/epimerase family protein [Bryobacterales bacterium]|nr:sugar phosphate isomerase/epimerase family protein [Bryobacterales bacterium]
MSFKLRHAICNEVYQGWDFAESCRSMRSIGYEGIEIAPFTLSEFPAEISADERREFGKIIREEGLTFVGLHWLMVAPKGLHVTTPDQALRQRGWQHIRDLVTLCSDIGPNGVMIFGSPAQRTTTGGISREEATKHYRELLAWVAPYAEERGVRILVEALPKDQCDVVQSLEEAVSIVDSIASPAIRTMFDTHNAVFEERPHAELVDEYFDFIEHVHVNEMNGAHPGTADYDFKPLLATLAAKNYTGFVSLEAFDFKPGAETIARESLHFLNAEYDKIAS